MGNFRAESIEMMDLGFPAKVCFVPGCGIGDLPECVPPENKQNMLLKQPPSGGFNVADVVKRPEAVV